MNSRCWKWRVWILNKVRKDLWPSSEDLEEGEETTLHEQRVQAEMGKA